MKILEGSGLKKIDKAKSLRVVAYLGMDRPCRRVDYGELLVERIFRSRHKLAGLVIHPSDNLADLARKYSIPYISIPLDLLQPIAKIKTALAGNTQFREFYAIWLEHIRRFNADIGLSAWGYWIPNELFSMPPMGFINYHPAPLPQMRGMEPDTFAILEGRTVMYGTVHKVNHAFDCGDIVARTKQIPIHQYDTPVSVLENLNREGISTIIHTLNAFSNGTVKCEKQCAQEGTRTTRNMAREASFIDWERDTVDLLDRKLRAFCGQDIGIRLKGYYQNQLRDVVDLEGCRGKFKGRPGEVIGSYRGRGYFFGAPVIRVSDGVVVVRFGIEIIPLSYSSLFYNESPQEKLIAPGRRKRHTRKNIVRRSISI